jgi:dTMP kinase
VSFITFEGIEGSGKSTLVDLVAERVGERAVRTREPGGTAIGRALRSALLDPAYGDLTPVAELLLYFADRAQHVAEVVRPALEAGRVVLCDRYVESSLAYQGYGRGLGREPIRRLADIATGGLRPELIVFLDVPVELGLRRVGRRGEHDRLESETGAFHEKVRAGYLELMAAEPGRWLRLDATGAPARLLGSVWSELERRNLLGGARA